MSEVFFLSVKKYLAQTDPEITCGSFFSHYSQKSDSGQAQTSSNSKNGLHNQVIQNLSPQVLGFTSELPNGLGLNKPSCYERNCQIYRPASAGFSSTRAQSKLMALSQHSHLQKGLTAEQQDIQLGLGLVNNHTAQTTPTNGLRVLSDKIDLALSLTRLGGDFERHNLSGHIGRSITKGEKSNWKAQDDLNWIDKPHRGNRIWSEIISKGRKNKLKYRRMSRNKETEWHSEPGMYYGSTKLKVSKQIKIKPKKKEDFRTGIIRNWNELFKK